MWDLWGSFYIEVFVEKPVRRRPLRRLERRWQDNTKRDLNELGLDSYGLGQTREANFFEPDNVCSRSIKCEEFLD
jgi:hypothetical protein